MPKETLVKRGDEYLSCIQLSELEETYRREHPGKSRDRLRAARGIRRRGGRETVPVNHSKRSIHMIGALGDYTLAIQFHDNLTVASYVELIKHLHRRYRKVGIIADNTSALTGVT